MGTTGEILTHGSVEEAMCRILDEQTKRDQRLFFEALTSPYQGGLTLTKISTATGISYETIRSWAGHKGEPSVMSLTSARILAVKFPEYGNLLIPDFHPDQPEMMEE